MYLFTLCVLRCSLSAIYAASSKKVHRATHRTARNDWGGPLPTEHETSHRAGLSSRQPSPKSRWCYRSRSWTETRRRCWPTRPRLPKNFVNSCLSGLAWRISSAFRCTLLSSTRSAFYVFYVTKSAQCLQGRHLTFTVGYSKIKHGVQLWLYFNVFRKSDLWQDISDAILLFMFCKNRHFLGYECVSIRNSTWILLHWAAA